MKDDRDKHLTWAPEWLQDVIVLIGLAAVVGWMVVILGRVLP